MKKKKELYDRLKGEKKFKDENERENKYFDEIEKVVRNSKTYEEFKIKVEYVFEDLKKDYNKIIKKVIKIPENDEKDINKVKSILRDKYHIFIYCYEVALLHPYHRYFLMKGISCRCLSNPLKSP